MDEYTNQNQEPEPAEIPTNQQPQTPPSAPQEPQTQGTNPQIPPQDQQSQWQNQQNQQYQPPFQQYLSQGQQQYQQYQQYQPYPPQYQQPIPPKQSNGLALASMIVSIFALITCCIPFVQFPLAVVAIVLVILSKKGRPFHGFAIAGLVMAIISILISIAMTFYWGVVISMMNDPEFLEMYNEIMEMYQ